MMNEQNLRFWNISFEVYEALPRQGPGSRDCAARALRLCRGLPSSPAILDLGCGVGAQTLHLAELTSGHITAIDNHAPNIHRLNEKIIEKGMSQRLRAQVGDMADPKFPPESFDLVWSEGALYNIGIGNALRVCRRLLHPGGYIAFTDAVWRKENPPLKVRESFLQDYPTMGWINDVVAKIQEHEFELVGHFTLPDDVWWEDFYTPMEARITELHDQYSGDEEALKILDQIAEEPKMHRRYSDYYAYEFFTARRLEIS